MAVVTLPNSVAANGTATPATVALTGVLTGDLLVCIIAAIGTSPTIATPTGDTWVQVQKTNGASVSFAMYYLASAASGTHTPSSVLGGTVTGWVIATYEFTASGTLISSNQQTSAVAQLTNVFSASSMVGQTNPEMTFVYAVARATATITAQNTGLSSPFGSSAWSASVLPQAGVHGLSTDLYWGNNLVAWPCSWPSASGLLSGAVASVAIGATFTSTAQQSQNNTNISGAQGLYVPTFFQGMVGG